GWRAPLAGLCNMILAAGSEDQRRGQSGAQTDEAMNASDPIHVNSLRRLLKQICVANRQFYQGWLRATGSAVARASPKARCEYMLTLKVGACSQAREARSTNCIARSCGKSGKARGLFEVETVTCETNGTALMPWRQNAWAAQAAFENA